ncbi:MAG: glycosyltransferase family 25 protein [Holosporaceae bacterium]|jgi:glycosyl transferase family 25|nr:glycosyltransferase family 25 protein [Holosporaceae bacterium]
MSRIYIDGGVGSYLINLDRANERLTAVSPRILTLGFPFERISAIDGIELSREEIERVADTKTYREIFKMSPETGTIGCSLSHKKAWCKFLESDNEFALVFEDDVLFDPSELREIILALIERKTLWDIVSFEVKHHGCPVSFATLNYGKASGKRLVFYLTNVTHAGCYLVNRKAVCEMLRKFYPIKFPLDHYFSAAWEFGIRFVGIEPRVVSQMAVKSQIKVEPNEKNAKISFANIVHNVQRSIIHFTYNLLCWIRSQFDKWL